MMTFTRESQQRLSTQVRRWERTPQNRQHVDGSQYRSYPLMVFGATAEPIEHNTFGNVFPGTYNTVSGSADAETLRALNPSYKIVATGCPVTLMRCALAFGDSQWVIINMFAPSRFRTNGEVEDRTNNPQTVGINAAIDWYAGDEFQGTTNDVYSYCLNLTMNDERQKRIELYWDASAVETRFLCYSADCPA